MLRLHLPQPMPHALPRDRPLDFYTPSRSVKADPAQAMQLPVPSYTNPRELDAFIRRRPLTPPSDSAMSMSSLPPVRASNPAANGHGAPDYTYQLPAIGNHVRANPSRSSTPQSQHSHQAQDMNFSQQQTSRSGNGAISERVRIPASIKTPQESLAALAAEVTCLFWFENSSTLKQALNSSSPRPTQPLVPDAIPTTGFRKWVATILVTTQVASNVILLALLFIYRLKNTNPTVKGKPGSEYRLLTVALMLGNKFLDDNTYTNKTWAEVTGISVQEVHIMEVEFLSNMRYSLFTSQEQWEEWHVLLGKFGTFYDRATKIVPQNAISPLGPPTPSRHFPHKASPTPFQTSPPTSRVSPPNAAAYPQYRPQITAPPTLQPTPNAVAPIGTYPELGPLSQRKRSHDDTAEPPPKRVAHGFAPGPYNNAPLIPTLQMPVNRSAGPPTSAHRLPPLPSLSIPAPQQNPPPQVNNWSDLSLPPPGSRSMAMVYNAPSQWPQNLLTPTSTAAPSYPTSRTPTAGDRSRQASPYPMSAGSSPISASYQTNQRQLSPSYFLSQRSSPYRPVCGVQTLLVPPPSTAMHNAPNNIRYDQMQYHSLGRPSSDRGTGPLPYLPAQPWMDSNNGAYHHQTHLPQLQPQIR